MLIIRTQKRETLCKVDYVTLRKNPNGYEVHSTNNVLGYYSSKEKALKVLDMIEEAALQKDYFTVGNGYPIIKEQLFQMPQDNEVSV